MVPNCDFSEKNILKYNVYLLIFFAVPVLSYQEERQTVIYSELKKNVQNKNPVNFYKLWNYNQIYLNNLNKWTRVNSSGIKSNLDTISFAQPIVLSEKRHKRKLKH